jgi:hypothetical protein
MQILKASHENRVKEYRRKLEEDEKFRKMIN